MAKIWHKYRYDDFAHASNGRPYIYGQLKGEGNVTKIARFFQSKVDNGYVYIHDDVVKEITDINQPYEFVLPMEEL